MNPALPRLHEDMAEQCAREAPITPVRQRGDVVDPRDAGRGRHLHRGNGHAVQAGDMHGDRDVTLEQERRCRLVEPHDVRIRRIPVGGVDRGKLAKLRACLGLSHRDPVRQRFGAKPLDVGDHHGLTLGGLEPEATEYRAEIGGRIGGPDPP